MILSIAPSLIMCKIRPRSLELRFQQVHTLSHPASTGQLFSAEDIWALYREKEFWPLKEGHQSIGSKMRLRASV